MSLKFFKKIITLLGTLKRNPQMLVGIIITSVICALALMAPFLATHDPLKQELTEIFELPSEEHIFGTDHIGRDVYSRILHGAKLSLISGILPILIATFLGTILGILPGYFGGYIDSVFVRVIDFLFAFPTLLIGIIIAVVLGPGFETAVLAIGMSLVPRFARIVRSSTISVREETYVKAAKVLGCSNLRIIFRHILPNIATPILIFASISIPMAIAATASLAFIGLGSQPPTPDWGLMISQGARWMIVQPAGAIYPGLFITVTALGFNFIGDTLRDILDPQSRY